MEDEFGVGVGGAHLAAVGHRFRRQRRDHHPQAVADQFEVEPGFAEVDHRFVGVRRGVEAVLEQA